jgi:hypothetical protein
MPLSSSSFVSITKPPPASFWMHSATIFTSPSSYVGMRAPSPPSGGGITMLIDGNVSPNFVVELCPVELVTVSPIVRTPGARIRWAIGFVPVLVSTLPSPLKSQS